MSDEKKEIRSKKEIEADIALKEAEAHKMEAEVRSMEALIGLQKYSSIILEEKWLRQQVCSLQITSPFRLNWQEHLHISPIDSQRK